MTTLIILIESVYCFNNMSACLQFCFRSQNSRSLQIEKKLDLTNTIKDGARLFFTDEGIRRQLLLAMTEDSKLHIEEVSKFEPLIAMLAIIQI